MSGRRAGRRTDEEERASASIRGSVRRASRTESSGRCATVRPPGARPGEGVRGGVAGLGAVLRARCGAGIGHAERVAGLPRRLLRRRVRGEPASASSPTAPFGRRRASRHRLQIGSGAVAPDRPAGSRPGKRRARQSRGRTRPRPLRGAAEAPRSPDSPRRDRRRTRQSRGRDLGRSGPRAEGRSVVPAGRRAASWSVTKPPSVQGKPHHLAAVRADAPAPPRISIPVSSGLIRIVPVIALATNFRRRPRSSRRCRPSSLSALARSRWWQGMTG